MYKKKRYKIDENENFSSIERRITNNKLTPTFVKVLLMFTTTHAENIKRI